MKFTARRPFPVHREGREPQISDVNGGIVATLSPERETKGTVIKMRRLLTAITVVASLGLPAFAAEGVDLSVRSRDQAAAMQKSVKNVEAPFRVSRDPMSELFTPQEEAFRGPKGACEVSSRDLCYDLASGKVVYRRARAYMPTIDGLKAESISVKRDRITFKYSF